MGVRFSENVECCRYGREQTDILKLVVIDEPIRYANKQFWMAMMILCFIIFV